MIVHVVGARPNFVKAAPVIHAVEALGLEQTLVHTGQHYSDALSTVFFEELELRKPDLDLGVGSGTHARQTAALLTGLEDAFTTLAPRMVVTYGDVNSTLAAALVASKLWIPIAHVEAGLRSFDRTMPEEVNRVLTDAVSDLLFVTSPEAVGHLSDEGVEVGKVHFVGNTMIDSLVANLPHLDPDAFRAAAGIQGDYAVATLHRPSNVDDAESARPLVEALLAVAEQVPVVLPLHPRGREVLASVGLESSDRLHVAEPMGYRLFLSGVRGARVVVTDSGGVQEETTVLGVPCLTVRPNTERPITLTHGTNRLASVTDLPSAVGKMLAGDVPVPLAPPPLWDGHAGERVAGILARSLS